MTESGHHNYAEHEAACIFCKIGTHEAPATILHEDDKLIIFMSLEGYPLIVTKKHIENYLDSELDDETSAKLGLWVKRLAPIVSDVYDTGSVTIISTNGADSGQEINHLHIHVMPREDEDRRVTFRIIRDENKPRTMARADYLRNRLANFSPKSL